MTAWFSAVMLLISSAAGQGISKDAPGNCATSIIGSNNIVINRDCLGMSQKAVERIARKALKDSGGDVNQWRRALKPGVEPTPPNTCSEYLSKRVDRGLLILAGSAASYCSKDTCTFISARSLHSRERVPLIWARRQGDILLISARIFDEKGQLIAKLDDGKPERNPSEIWQAPQRPDPSTIVFRDNRDNALFRVHLLNKHAISLEGTLFAPDSDKVSRSATITSTGITISANGQRLGSFAGSCAVDSGSAYGF